MLSTVVIEIVDTFSVCHTLKVLAKKQQRINQLVVSLQ